MSIDKNNVRATDSLRGIFALLIVWHHFAPLSNIPYSFDFGNTIVLFFFVLSGYGISLSWKNRIAGSERTFLANRFSKIFPIQWLTVILFVLFGINVVSYWAIPFHLTLTQSIVPFWQINFSLNVPSWFLSSLFFCYLCTPFLLKYANKHRQNFVKLYICTMIAFVLFTCVVSDYLGLRWLAYLNPGVRLLDYSLGIILGLFFLKGEKVSLMIEKYSCHKFIYTVIEVLLIVSLFAFMICKPLIELNNYAVIRYPIIAGVIVLFSISKGFVSSLLKNRVLHWLGGISMSIYMVHGFILHFSVGLKGYFPIVPYVILTYVIILIVAYFTERLLSVSSKRITTIANKFLI